MPSRHRLEKKLLEKRLPHDVDLTGIAVALAFLVCVGLFAGDRDNSGSEDGQSPSVSMHIAPTVTMEKTETLQHPDDDPDLSETSRQIKSPR